MRRMDAAGQKQKAFGTIVEICDLNTITEGLLGFIRMPVGWSMTNLSSPWLTLVAILVLVYLPLGLGDEKNATVILNDAEELVQEIGSYALQNYLNAQGLAKTCADPQNCSRLVCAPLERDLAELSCEAGNINPDCQETNSNTSCTTLLVNRQRSYVWWSQDADLQSQSTTCEMKSTICAQRQLDTQVFQPRGHSVDFKVEEWQYFGSNGILRIFPGKELTETLCNTYEVRQRPWYAGAWAVQKEVVVLLDAGPLMGQLLSLSLPGQPTFFDAARNITLRLMNTLGNGDSFSVITFDGSATVLEPKINVNVSTSFSDQQTLQPLITQLKNAPDPGTSSGQSANLTAALMAGRDRFGQQRSQMKVFVIVTSGDLIGPKDLEPELLSSLTALNVTVFMYRLVANSSTAGMDSVSTTLRNASCVLNAWLEEDIYHPQDPLGTLDSFFSYFAQLRSNYTGAKPFWVARYQGHFGDADLITVSKPVFNGSFLVGVAGIDVAVDNLGQISDDVTTELARRNGISFISIPDPPKIPCGQTLSQSAKYACTDASGLCINDVANTQEAFRDRTCCGGCPASKSGGSHDGANLAGAIVGGVLGGILLLICVALCGMRCARSAGRWPRRTMADPPWSSSTEDTVL